MIELEQIAAKYPQSALLGKKRAYPVSLRDSLEPYVQPIGKLFAAWSLTLYGMVTLHNLAVLAGLVFSCMQIYVLWKKEFRKPKN